MKILVTIATAVLYQFSCADDQEIIVRDNTLRFNALISSETLEIFKEKFSSNIKEIIVTSMGGDGYSALEMAKIIKNSNAKLRVDRYCLSACANYLFMAAKEKNLLPGAILGFHGGLAGAPVPSFTMLDIPKVEGMDEKIVEETVLNPLNLWIKNYQEVESKFFNEIGVNPELLQSSLKKTIKNWDGRPIILYCPNVSLDKIRNIMHYSCLTYSASGETYFFPSEKTLKKYGVRGIVDYPYPKNNEEFNSFYLNSFVDKQKKYEIVLDL